MMRLRRIGTEAGSACVLLMLVAACAEQAGDGVESSAVWKDDTDGQSRSAELARQYPIVFVSNRDGSEFGDLYLMSVEGGGRDALLVAPGADHFHPRWAPDASSIVVRRIVDGLYADVALVAPDGTQLVYLTQGEDVNAFGYAPNWSADGASVSFGSIRPEGTFVWVVSRFGGSSERLFPSLTEEHREAVWSPDGSRLAFSAQIGMGRRRDLFVAEASDLSGAVNLTQGSVYAPGFLRWSPDGTRVAFASATVLDDGSPEPGAPSVDGAYAAPDMELFVVDVESSELTRLTDNELTDITPGWSPDGTQLIFSSDRDGDSDLWVIAADGSGEARDLIDDVASPSEELLSDWYGGPR